jgi:hypothetical protein
LRSQIRHADLERALRTINEQSVANGADPLRVADFIVAAAGDVAFRPVHRPVGEGAEAFLQLAASLSEPEWVAMLKTTPTVP